MSEFELISRCFLPLTGNCAEADGLANDAAILPGNDQFDLAVTLDSLVEDVHFLASDPPDRIGHKILCVNLSDLAAMGARPYGYLMAFSLSQQRGGGTEIEAWAGQVTAGLAAAQATFGGVLFGGDTTATPGPTTFSITALGQLPKGQALRRSTARAGDDLYVSGSLGDAAIGLVALRGHLPDLAEVHHLELIDSYQLPEPRLALGQVLLSEKLASAAMDVSDGLLADVGHIAEASGLKAIIWEAQVPLSVAAEAAISVNPDLRDLPFCGGDDYEILFTAEPAKRALIEAQAEALKLPITRIGRMDSGSGVEVLTPDQRPRTFAQEGWVHF